MSRESAVDYSNLIPRNVLESAGLTLLDVDSSIQLAHLLSEAVKMRRAKIRQESAVLSPEEEKAEDDRIFLGVVTLLAQRIKPRKPKPRLKRR